MPTYLPHNEYVKKIRSLMEQNVTDMEFTNLLKYTGVAKSDD